MNARRVPVFFYGLFMDADLLRDKGARPTPPRRASISGYRFLLGHRAALVEAQGRRVHGTLMELTHSELDVLYAEESLSRYRAEPVLCEFDDGSRLAALCFNLPDPPTGEADPAYLSRLLDAARRARLPRAYIDEIASLAAESAS